MNKVCTNRPGIMFYFDTVQPLLTQLTDEQVGQIFRAAFEYGQHGLTPSLEPGIVAMAWALLKPAIDRDADRYDNVVLQRKYAVYVREMQRHGRECMSFDEYKHTISIDNDRHRPITKEADDIGRYPTTTSTTTPDTTSNSISITDTSPKTTADNDRHQSITTDDEYENPDVPF